MDQNDLYSDPCYHIDFICVGCSQLWRLSLDNRCVAVDYFCLFVSLR